MGANKIKIHLSKSCHKIRIQIQCDDIPLNILDRFIKATESESEEQTILKIAIEILIANFIEPVKLLTSITLVIAEAVYNKSLTKYL